MQIIFKDTSACICTKSSPFWNELDKSVLVTLACVMVVGVCLTFMVIILIFILTRKLFSRLHKNWKIVFCLLEFCLLTFSVFLISIYHDSFQLPFHKNVFAVDQANRLSLLLLLLIRLEFLPFHSSITNKQLILQFQESLSAIQLGISYP